MAGEISRKHQQFINEYIRLRCSNSTEAYCRVYPNSSRDAARSSAPEILANPSVAAEIDRRVKEVTMSADEVLMRIADEARGDMGEFWSIQADGDPVLDLVSAQERGKLHLIKKLKVKTTTRTIGDVDVTTKEVDFELYDAQAAKRMIGQHHKLFAERTEVSGPKGGPIEYKDVGLTDEERITRAVSLFDRARERRARKITGNAD